MPEAYIQLEDSRLCWKECESRTGEWVDAGLQYAKCLHQVDEHEAALGVCKRLMGVAPSSARVKRNYGWALYRCFIKADQDVIKRYDWKLKRFLRGETENEPESPITKTSEILRNLAAKRILSMSAETDPYSAYNMTGLAMAEYYMYRAYFEERNGSSELCDEYLSHVNEWLSHLDPCHLKTESLSYCSHDEEMCWSQLRLYLDLQSKYQLQANEDVGYAIRPLLKMLEECENSPRQIKSVNARLMRMALGGRGPADICEESLSWPLKQLGFLDDEFNSRYKNALLKKSGVETCDDRNWAVRNAARSLGSARIAQYKVQSKDVNTAQAIAASSLANFVYCPASYAIQESFYTETSDVAMIGNWFHEQQILIYEQKKKDRNRFYNFTKTGDRSQINGLLRFALDEAVEALLTDIQESKLVVDGHGEHDATLFYDTKRLVVGAPDYVFERKDGTRFVVEEKFYCQKQCSKIISSPYDNHLLQLGAYLTRLADIHASDGYLVYWKYSFVSNKAAIAGAQSFRVNGNQQLADKVDEGIKRLRKFREQGNMTFNVAQLNPWKCVNCVTSDLCIHKTGKKQKLFIPYRGLKSKTFGSEGKL